MTALAGLPYAPKSGGTEVFPIKSESGKWDIMGRPGRHADISEIVGEVRNSRRRSLTKNTISPGNYA